MNKKIEELALQAGGSHFPRVGGKNLENFAELLIQECAKIADTAEPYKASDLIKQHFGVE
jgi:hypothetical protein